MGQGIGIMITFEEPEVVYCFSVKGFEFMMDSILKDTYLVQIAVTDNTDNALQRVLNMYERTSRRLCAMKRIEEIKLSRLNK
ncbi:Uncharacterised protein [Escherichia coli]|nr:Uncharacterised protein [Escherichia coli]